MKVTQEWYGPEFLARLNQAAGRAIATIGVNVAIETKRVTHVQFGTLRRSVHAAPATQTHDGDLNTATSSDMLNMAPETDESPWGPSIEVGSWLPYACVEWVGRGHPGVTEGMEMVRGARVQAIVAQAFYEAGLGGHGGRGARVQGGPRGGGGPRGKSHSLFGGGVGGGEGHGRAEQLADMLRRQLEHGAEGK